MEPSVFLEQQGGRWGQSRGAEEAQEAGLMVKAVGSCEDKAPVLPHFCEVGAGLTLGFSAPLWLWS